MKASVAKEDLEMFEEFDRVFAGVGSNAAGGGAGDDDDDDDTEDDEGGD